MMQSNRVLNKNAQTTISKKSLLLMVSASLLLSACASKPVAPVYVSSAIYKDYTCAQLEHEYKRLKSKLYTTDTNTQIDSTGVNVGIVGSDKGISPRISIDLGKSNYDNKQEIARLKGEKEAIEAASIFKGCEFVSTLIINQKTKAVA